MACERSDGCEFALALNLHPSACLFELKTVSAMTKHRNDYQGITFIPKLDDDDLGIAGATPRSSWPRMVLLVACYAAAAAAGIFCVHSLTGWLVIGLAPVLLLDRMTFRILSPTGPESRIIQ